jgi:exodeoxyribonuclease VII large subunit
VQGVEAPGEIVAAINKLNRDVHPDVILLVRGGGSMEDLWAFNNEGVVFAVAESEAPVVTGIGHETDFTLADFAADVRAPTPTGAAVLATPSRDDLLAELQGTLQDLNYLVRSMLDSAQTDLDQAHVRLNRESPVRRVERERQQVDSLSLQLGRDAAHRLEIHRVNLKNAAGRLAALDPRAVLHRGYALVQMEDGTIVRSAEQLAEGNRLNTRFSRGSAISRVESTRLD